MFNVYKKVDVIEFDFLRKQNLVECENQFKKYIEKEKLDYKKVQALTYLIYLNKLRRLKVCLLSG